jgi:hypothetical protein
MPDYQQGKIYAIRSYLTDEVYIGSTTTALSQRMAIHRDVAKKDGLCSSKNILQKDPKAYIELIEAYPCNNREELCKREGEIIRATNNCINKSIAGRTVKEWYQDNKQHCRELNKIWFQNNKEKRNEWRKQYKAKKKLESSNSNESNPLLSYSQSDQSDSI